MSTTKVYSDYTSHDVVFDSENSQYVCIKCGLVFEDHVPTNYEINQSNSYDEKSFTPVHAPKTVSIDLKRAIKRGYQEDWATRRERKCYAETERICDNYGLPQIVRKNTIYYLKKCFQQNVKIGRIKSFVIACIYYNCNQQGISLDLSQISDEEEVNSRLIRKYMFKLVKTFKLRSFKNNPINYLPKIITSLGLPDNFLYYGQQLCSCYLNHCNSSGLNNKGIVAGAVYLLCQAKGYHVSQDRIAKSLGISDITLRTRYKELIHAYQASKLSIF